MVSNELGYNYNAFHTRKQYNWHYINVVYSFYFDFLFLICYVLVWCFQKTHEKLISKWSCILKESVQFNCHFDLNKKSLMVVGFTNTCAIGANHHQSCEIELRSWRGVLDTTLCDKVHQWFATGWWFSVGTPVFSNNKTVLHDITELLLKEVLKTIKQTKLNKHKTKLEYV